MGGDCGGACGVLLDIGLIREGKIRLEELYSLGLLNQEPQSKNCAKKFF